MSKETELSKTWFSAWRLRQEGKNITLPGEQSLVGAIEERLFEEADKRIDREIERRRKNEMVLYQKK